MVWPVIDWIAMVLLVTAYYFLAKKPLWGSALIAVSDVFWIIFAIQTEQIPLGLVSFISGLFALRALYVWRYGKEPGEDTAGG